MNKENWLSQLESSVWNNWYILIPVALGLWVISVYNKIIKLSVSADRAWHDIDTVLKQRVDMIPNLVEIVKGYAKHESETLTKVIEARSKVSQMNIDIKNATPAQMAAFQSAQGEMSQMLGKLFALSESYPDLKANQNFMALQSDLKTLEDKLNHSRRYYNGVVKNFNEAILVFPSNVIAKMFGFKERQYFEINEKDRENVKIKF